MPDRDAALDPVANWRAVRAAVERVVRAAGRDPGAVELLAVGKGHGAEAMRALLEAGHRAFGENRVQEAEAKWPALRRDFPDLRLHLIGHLQTNKARDAVALFDAIETVDSERLAAALAREMARAGKRPDCFVEVNIGAEPQKGGVPPEAADAFVETCRGRLGLPIVGLMCIPPAGADPMPHFLALGGIAARHGLKRLSMGMTADYEAAVAAGSTEVRVGTAIFGERRPAQ